jgi:hypothetical protein
MKRIVLTLTLVLGTGLVVPGSALAERSSRASAQVAPSPIRWGVAPTPPRWGRVPAPKIGWGRWGGRVHTPKGLVIAPTPRVNWRPAL